MLNSFTLNWLRLHDMKMKWENYWTSRNLIELMASIYIVFQPTTTMCVCSTSSKTHPTLRKSSMMKLKPTTIYHKREVCNFIEDIVFCCFVYSHWKTTHCSLFIYNIVIDVVYAFFLPIFFFFIFPFSKGRK